LFNKPWPYDVYCKDQASISRYKYDSYLDVAKEAHGSGGSNATTGINIYKSVLRHYAMTQIFDKIGDNEALLKFKGITVDDLLIDLKFDYKEKVDEISVGVTWMTKIPTGYGGVGAEDARIKPGNAMRLMPIFLSPQYNEILYNEKIDKTNYELEHLGK